MGIPALAARGQPLLFLLQHIFPTFLLFHRLFIRLLITWRRLQVLFFPITSVSHPAPGDLVRKNQVPKTEKREAKSQYVPKTLTATGQLESMRQAFLRRKEASGRPGTCEKEAAFELRPGQGARLGWVREAVLCSWRTKWAGKIGSQRVTFEKMLPTASLLRRLH